jgi:hypothetical protein
MLTPLLLAAVVAVPLAVSPARPLVTEPSSSATVFANRTAFSRPCVSFTSTAPDRLAAQASAALRALGWSVNQTVGPQFNQREALREIAPAGAIYVHSHGDHYWNAVAARRSSGFRVDGGHCTNAPTVLSPEISSARQDAAPLILAVISTCHNGERASTLPQAFGIALQRVGPGAAGPRSFYLSYSGLAWVRGITRFEQRFWRALRRGLSAGAAFDQGLLSGFSPAELTPEWWGNYNLIPTAPSNSSTPPGGSRNV